MLIKRYESCRSLGRVYTRIALGFESGSLADASTFAAEGRLRAKLIVSDVELPAKVRPLHGEPPSSSYCVLDYPYLEVDSAEILVWDAENLDDKARLKVNFKSAKWESRINRRLKKGLLIRLTQGENNLLPGCFNAHVQRYFQGEGGNAVWRVVIEWRVDTSDGPASGSVVPSLECFASSGKPLEASPVLLEQQRGVRMDSWLTVDRLVYSLSLDDSHRAFTVKASTALGEVADGFCCMDPGVAGSMQNDYWNLTKDACGDDDLYRSWLVAQRPSEIDLYLQSGVHIPGSPLFSIVMPCYESDEGFLREAVASVVGQSYQDWELILLDASPERDTVRNVSADCGDSRVRYCRLMDNGGIVANTNKGIKLAKGTHVAFLDHDDALEPDALYCYARAASESGARVLYCDEDSFHFGEDYGQPSFKSDFNRDLLYCHNYVTHFLVVEKNLIDRIGVCDEEVSGAQDYDLVLRALAAGAEPYHVPRVLYHWRIHDGSSNDGNVESKPYAVEAGRLALQNHFRLRGVKGKVEALEGDPFTYRMRYTLPSPLPLVSVIIPTRDNSEMLKACVESLFCCTYKNIEVVLVENGSKEARTEQVYAALQKEHPGQIKVVRWKDGFNYSALINFGARAASGEYLLLLNNDTEVISCDFIEEMMGYLQRPEVGVVGAKLFFKDGLVQHAGMLVGPYDALVHVHQFFPEDRVGYLARAKRPGNFSAVTGACQMVRKAVFDEVGGYCEEFAVGFNDADFCLRIRKAGYCVTFTPYAQLYHYEFVSRGREMGNREKELRWKREQALFMELWPGYFVEGDPFSNQNLKRNNLYFALGE